jgi:hypothetical protein
VSLFDVGDHDDAQPSADPDTILDADDEAEPERKTAAPARPADGKIDDASSLFDL